MTVESVKEEIIDIKKRLDALERGQHDQGLKIEQQKNEVENFTKGPEEFRHSHNKYQTNFIRGPSGNGISRGSELLVKIKGADSVTGRIAQHGRLIMVDQSTERDEDNDIETINFKLKEKTPFYKSAKDLPPGDYELHV